DRAATITNSGLITSIATNVTTGQVDNEVGIKLNGGGVLVNQNTGTIVSGSSAVLHQFSGHLVLQNFGLIEKEGIDNGIGTIISAGAGVFIRGGDSVFNA